MQHKYLQLLTISFLLCTALTHTMQKTQQASVEKQVPKKSSFDADAMVSKELIKKYQLISPALAILAAKEAAGQAHGCKIKESDFGPEIFKDATRTIYVRCVLAHKCEYEEFFTSTPILEDQRHTLYRVTCKPLIRAHYKKDESFFNLQKKLVGPALIVGCTNPGCNLIELIMPYPERLPPLPTKEEVKSARTEEQSKEK